MKPDARARLEAWLSYYQDLGLHLFYRDRTTLISPTPLPADIPRAAKASTLDATRGFPMPPRAKSVPPAAQAPVLPVFEPSLFDAADRIEGDTLERIREDIGDCTRCSLCKKRTNIVFGVGNPRAELVFVGEGPGHDEDAQGIPFVGRAGQLLTQMVEAMGLRRDDVYICNVVKCRPPGNRLPEKDEIATCSPFLLRQLAAIRPKVVVALGACAVQTLLGGPVAITKLRGQWLDYRGMRLMPTYHPAYLLRNPNAKPDAWKDLQMVMAVLGLKPVPRKRV